MKKVKDDGENSQRSEAAEELIKYFESLEDFKTCQDEVRAAALLESLNLTLDHVHGHMLKFEEV